MAEEMLEYTRKWQTEYYTVLQMITHKFPSSVYKRSYASPASVYRSPRMASQVTRLSASDGYLIGEWGRAQLWRICSNCSGEYPETREYWHRDSNGRNGYQTVCKYCRCESRNEDYRRQKQLLPA